MGLRTATAWSTASSTRVGEDGGAQRGSTMVGNDGFGEVLTMARRV
jgi:hypothetical protein